MTGKVAQAPPSYHGHQGRDIPSRSRTRGDVQGTRQVNKAPPVISVQPQRNRSTQFTVHGNNAYQSRHDHSRKRPSYEAYHPDCTFEAVAACLCCFAPTAIAALVFALRANHLYKEGEIEKAQEKAFHAKNLVISSVVIGLTFYIASLVVIAISLLIIYWP